jgi:hypothetical protein
MNTQTVSVKDFVIDIKEANKNISGQNRSYSTPSATYNVILQNDIDFVMHRKTKTTDKNFVFLVSQATFYIQDNKTKLVESLDKAKIQKFFEFATNVDIKSKLEKVQWWNESIYTCVPLMAEVVKDKARQTLFKHHIFTKYPTDIEKEMISNNPKLFQYCKEKNINNNAMSAANYINKNINYNNAIYFVDAVAKSNVKFGLYDTSYDKNLQILFDILKTHNLNLNRLVDYLMVDLYAQGIQTIDKNTIIDYRDYLNMQTKLYGKVKEKYPKYLKTEHDIVALKLTIYEKYNKDLIIFNTATHHSNLEYKTRDYSIVLPQSSMDIVDEGINLSHCVAEYVDRVVNGDTYICFLRETEDRDKSLVTLEVKNNALKQAKGFGNRKITEDEEKFLKKWCAAKQLDYHIQ